MTLRASDHRPSECDFAHSRTETRGEAGDLILRVVLPAGNLECLISRHLDQQGVRLDSTTRALLAMARDGFNDIARSGTDLAARSRNQPRR
ncbi:MAG: hypothetical protein AAF415_03330 [Pseudomonadota bacterium]